MHLRPKGLIRSTIRCQLVFATRKRCLVFYSLKGRRQNSMQFPEDITDIEQFYYEPKQYNGVLVVLGSEIHLYVDQVINPSDHPITLLIS